MLLEMGAMKGSRLRARLPPVLKPCKLQSEMDLTLKNPSVFRLLRFYNAKSTFSSQITPCIHQDFERYPPKWFSAITCTTKTVYGSVCFFEGGVLHGFSVRILCFFMPGDRSWRPGSDFGAPRSTFWPGDVLGVILGSRKR